jgi:hypothetical protein
MAATEPGSYELERNGDVVSSGLAELVLDDFDWYLRRHIAENAPDHIFVHAGVVAHRGRAILVPGLSFSGKTTLVIALVRGGATYYSDEYALLDLNGMVHPYPKPLSIRLAGDGGRQTEHHVSQLGGSAGTDPVPVGLVVSTQYRVDAQWRPVELSPSEAVLEVMPHVFPIADRLQASLAALGHAFAGVRTLKGDRGEADELAAELLATPGSEPG